MANPNIGPLLAGDQASFPQTGSWNMVEFAKLPAQATIGTLSRYMAGRVNPYTVLVCEGLCDCFRLTARGRANIENAVSKLSAVGTVGAALEFGFGIEDLIRSMAKLEQGMIVLALCAALRETYSIDIAAEVLLEIARLSRIEGKWMPSSLEWKALLNACSGILAATPFGLRAEVLMQLGNDGQRLGAYRRTEASPQDLRDCSSPKSIAEALFAIAAVSRRDFEAVTLVGGPDTGWIAAVAEWILDLNVSITNSAGEVVYSGTNNDRSGQIQIISGPKTPNFTDIAVQGRTYILKEISEVLGKEAASKIVTTVSGRLDWKTALRRAFLHDFKRMMESLPSILGTLFGSAARLLNGLAEADQSFPMIYRVACTSYGHNSYGLGFVDTMISWFPELAVLRHHMEKAAQNSLGTAKKDYESAISRLRSDCDCRACQGSNGFDLDEDSEMTPAPDDDQEGDRESSDSETSDWDPDRYCAVIMAETIIVLSRTLANVYLADSEVLPMRSGFELAYGRQLILRNSAASGKSAIRELGQFAFCMDFDANFCFGMRDNDYGTGIRLDQALELFTGEQIYASSNNGKSAICKRGLCAYFRVLEDIDLSVSDPASIAVIPGRISYEGKSYTSLEDRYVPEDKAFQETMLRIVDSMITWSDSTISVRESAMALECLFQLWIPHDSGSEVYAAPGSQNNLLFLAKKPLMVGPAELVDFVAARRGLVHCNLKSGRRKKCLGFQGMTPAIRQSIKTNEQHHYEWTGAGPGNGVVFLSLKNSISFRIIAAHCASQPEYRSSIFIVGRECVDCCLRAATGVNTENRVYFISL